MKVILIALITCLSFSTYAQEMSFAECRETYPDIDVEECEMMASPHLISLSDEQWRFSLILDGCEDQLQREVAQLYGRTKNSSLPKRVQYPEVIGYQYFNISFMAENGKPAAVFQFSYTTERDLHVRCESIEPMDWVY